MTNKIREGGTDEPATADSVSKGVPGAAKDEFSEITVGKNFDPELAAILNQIVGQK